MGKNGAYADLVRAQEVKTEEDNVGSSVAAPISPFEAAGTVTLALPDPNHNLIKEDSVEALNRKEDSVEELNRKEDEKLLKENKTPLLRVAKLQKPEFFFVFVGIILCGCNGTVRFSDVSYFMLYYYLSTNVMFIVFILISYFMPYCYLSTNDMFIVLKKLF